MIRATPRWAEHWRIRLNAVFSNRKEVGDGSKGRCARSMKTFGEGISELRKERGLTQKALAAQIKKKDGTAIGLAYITHTEHDRRAPPPPHFLATLAAILPAHPTL